jgi:hypothetical protein
LIGDAPGWWRSTPVRLRKGRYAYKFRIDQSIGLDDPANSRKQPDGVGGFNAVFEI